MTGETNLQEVLKSMRVSCDDNEYGFATVSPVTTVDLEAVIGTFRETGGLTVIASKQYLDFKGITYEGPYAKLSIEVHTSLELVGLTAVLATKLAENNISANVVAAYYHDHVFVQYDLRQKATEVLSALK
jgi:hypothetical protein